MPRQEQQVEVGGHAIQAGKDVIIYTGMAPEQMAQIIAELAKNVAHLVAEGQKKAESRLEEFKVEVLTAFAAPGNANPAAFNDPDFQFALNEAQKGYARSGDKTVLHTLIDIIAKRSLQTERNRMAIALDEAVTRASLLTVNEFAVLSMVFLVRYTKTTVPTFQELCALLTKQLMPFVSDILSEYPSYWHIESQGCGVLEMGHVSLHTILTSNYAGVLGKGFTRQSLEEHLPDGKKDALNRYIIPCLHDSQKCQPKALEKNQWHSVAEASGLTIAELDNVWNLFASSIPSSEEELISLLAPHVPNVRALFDVWGKTPIRHLKLNTIGIAIGHANASKVVAFGAPLDTWIR